MRLSLIALTLPLLFAACGGESGSEDPASSPLENAAAEMPACADIWVDGQTLPDSYEGCVNGDTIDAPMLIACTDGGEFATYQDRFHATLGGTITEADPASKEYAADYRSCTS